MTARILHGPLVRIGAYGEKIGEIGIFSDALGEIGLRRWLRCFEIAKRLSLSLMEAGLNLEREHIPRPAVLDGLGRIPEAGRRGLQFVQKCEVVVPRLLCKGCLHNWRGCRRNLGKRRLHSRRGRLRPSASESTHVFQIARREPLLPRKLALQVMGKSIETLDPQPSCRCRCRFNRPISQ